MKNTKLQQAKHTSKFNYVPRLGIFENSAGNDPIDQLKFTTDQGFTAFEGNVMRNRPVRIPEKMRQTMQKMIMEMGVFVGHKKY